ncbi:hypothetical protein Ndes2437B_g09024 [Nannochloris sp. 'desiccata']
MHLLQSSSYLKRLCLWQIAVWSSGYFIATQRHRPPGLSRLALATSLAILNFILPLLFDGHDDAMTSIIVIMTTACLSNIKLLSWAMNRGPLAETWLTRMQCAAVYALTVIPAKERNFAEKNFLNPVPAETRSGLLIIKIIGLCIAVPAYALCIDRLPHFPSALLQGVCQYLSMSFFMDAASLLLWYFLKLPTAANFRFPYASTSPADFWNRRWNLPVSQAMRALIYDPFLEGRLIKPFEKEKAPSSSLSRNSNSNHNTKLLRRVIGVLLVFSVSGIVHEIMYWYVTGHTTRSALWLWYFIFSGLIVVVEGAVKQPLRRAGVQIPTWIQWIVTQFMFQKLMETMWWVPAEEADFPNIIMQHVKEGCIALDQLGEDFVGFFNYAVFKLQEAKY